jgi:predicted transposase/invertase (TIGR01784 family)
MPSRLIKRHDQFFKRLLDHAGTAGVLLRERLPKEVAERLAPDAPELVSGSFVDNELREYHTDRLYRVRTVDGEAAFIYALVEHKSSPDPGIGLQLLIYQTRVWQWWVEHQGQRWEEGGRRRLPAIFPLVIYHGKAEWRIPLDFASGIDLADDALRPYLLDFRYSLAELGRIDDARLSREKRLRIGLLILKRGSGEGDLREILLELGRAALSLGFDDLVALVHYILLESNEVEAAMLRGVLREIVPDQEARIMSIAAEEWKAEGIQIGQAMGKAEGKAEGKADMLLRLLRRRFDMLPEAMVAKVRNASEDQLNEWADNILDAHSLDMVFGAVKPN